jgi:hypothetical protein
MDYNPSMSEATELVIPTLADTDPSRFVRKSNNSGFQLGNTYGKGRPQGSRNKLEEAFLYGLQDDFRRYGPSAIVKCRKKDPVAYCKMIASLMPKSLNLTAKVEKLANELTEDDLVAMVIDLDPEPLPPSNGD